MKEQYHGDRLYPKSYIISILKNAPKELRSYIPKLQDIACENDKGQKTFCTRIPENIYVYLTGRY
jgi:hypothetical protein